MNMICEYIEYMICEYDEYTMWIYYQTKEKQITPSAQVADEFKLLFNSLFWLYKFNRSSL